MNRPKLLCVDNDPQVRKFYNFLFSKNGYEVFLASSGQEALQALKSHKNVDVVVSDFDMPGMSGAELASEIKTCNPQLPFVLVSGSEPALEEAPHFVDAAVPKGAPIQLMLDKLKALLAVRSGAHGRSFLSRFVPVGSVLAGIALGVLLLPKAFR